LTLATSHYYYPFTKVYVTDSLSHFKAHLNAGKKLSTLFHPTVTLMGDIIKELFFSNTAQDVKISMFSAFLYLWLEKLFKCECLLMYHMSIVPNKDTVHMFAEIFSFV